MFSNRVTHAAEAAAQRALLGEPPSNHSHRNTVAVTAPLETVSSLLRTHAMALFHAPWDATDAATTFEAATTTVRFRAPVGLQQP